jgi:hypothetical protein
VSLVVAGALLLGGAAGCAERRSSATTSSSTVDICAGYQLYQAQKEPRLDRKHVASYAGDLARLLDNIDPQLVVGDQKVRLTPRTVAELRTLRRAALRLQARAAAAGDDAALGAALGDFANDAAAQKAAADLEVGGRQVCQALNVNPDAGS